ncbi:RagB/SusD family nutrient uptake outer membrane protein [Chitinophaga ginsengisoli]|uniref:Putative outer membrane starch-binding protein n=1 Tax=Chitinophaga ginsengisoli TaxID=363837 RepID=A0A2P8FQW8_9BACT|nr:RagB/SusD family nutrient uptake outer membrane protein [Chitinophaga ginsengisoli]PSL24122.1 putative outer membrane starch-binding protein [Chitinophaga ginsengisoli]
MKLTTVKIYIAGMLCLWAFFTSSCTKDLLHREPTTELGTASFWKTEADATYALMGAYADIRPLFDRDYYFDGQGEYIRTRGTSTASGNLQKGDAYNGGDYSPSGYGDNFDKMYEHLYGGVHRANYVIENVRKMLPSVSETSLPQLERVVAEARLLRAMVYFRLISMWGDVPYIDHVIYDNSEVANMTRTPLAQVKDSILADLTYAFDKLPVKAPELGRASKPAALAFRGKVQLYWACWNKFGWPELDTFTPDEGKGNEAYKAAADDFNKVINDYGLTLFRGGEPGECDVLGKADKLPNYYYLFTSVANGDAEMIMSFTHGGTGTNQGEELMRDVAGRSHEGSQCWVSPRYEIADRYQSTITGDFAPKLIPMNPTTAGARTAPNSAVNPQSYANRDYRMKSSIMWDFEVSVGMISLKSTGWVPFIYKTWNQPVTIDGVKYTTYNTDGCNSGYVLRKFLRNTAGLGRSDGTYSYPVMRLADVYLMYAEATNAINGPQADAIALVNRVRHRGNLPPLAGDKTASKEAFFSAIEQERIVELFGEGQRSFDIRRWRAIERVWNPPYGNGVWRIDSYGVQMSRYFQNMSEREYQQCYIFRIPPGERNRNPNLTQNTPWL